MRQTNVVILVFGAIVFTLQSVSYSALMTYSTSDSQFDGGIDNQGWWSTTQANSDSNDNYFTGLNGGNDLRSFFTFDLSSLGAGDTISSGTLMLTRFSSGSNEATEDLGLFDVSTDAATLNNNVGTSAAIHSDLGSGTSYGTFTIPGTGSNSDVLSFTLNAAAIADLNAAKGGFFSIGIDLLTQDGDDAVFSGSGSSGTQDLVLDVNPAATTPIPAALPIGLMGMAGVAYLRKRRGKASPAEAANATPVEA